MKKNLSLFMFLMVGVFITNFTFAQNAISGTIKEKSSGSPLIGATVSIKNTTKGTITDVSGNYALKSDKPFPWTVVVSYTGYKTLEATVDKSGSTLNFSLEDNTTNMDEIVVSASRRAEKIQDSPAAISVINSKKIQLDNVANPMLSLRNMTGVDISQSGVGDGQINLRGRGAVFNTETFIIADYRNVIIPSLGTMLFSQMPVDAVDLDRIEVVKGPGGALYGPGVEAGVVHFISKSPFKEQGTTVSLGIGNQNQYQAAFRTAGVSKNKKWGFKLTGFYRQSTDFSNADSLGNAKVAAYTTSIKSAVTGLPISTCNCVNYNSKSLSLTGSVEYKFSPKASVVGVVGFGEGAGFFKTGQGGGYQDITRPFAQVRYQNGGFFAQAFWSKQNGNDGSAYLYTTGLTNINVINQMEGQVQYEFNATEKLNMIVGGDYRRNTIDTQGTLDGRFENTDNYMTMGAYAQAKYAISDKLDFIGAGRIDRFDALSQTAFSPRLGLVFKADKNNTFRLTWNKAIGAPSALQLYNDFLNAQTANFGVWLNAGSQPFTFNNNNVYNFATKQTSNTTDLSLQTAYAIVTQGLVGKLPAAATTALAGLTSKITGTTSGSLITSTGLPAAPISRGLIGLSTSNMFEFGYQGRFLDRFTATVDLYTNTRDNNLTPAMLGSTFIGYANAGTDLAAVVTANVPAALAASLGKTPAQIGAIYKAGIESNTINAKTGALTPVGLLSADQDPTGKNLDYTYFNIDKINYWGADLGLNFNATKALSFFTNYSYLSQTYWSSVSVKNSASSVPFSLNQPGNRFRLGVDYIQAKGFVFNAVMRYSGAWTSVNGTAYSGDVPAYTVFDAGIGYGFTPKFRINITATDIFDTKIVNVPHAAYMGRLVLAKTTFSF